MAEHSDRLSELRGAELTECTSFVNRNPAAALKAFRKLLDEPQFNKSGFWWPRKGGGGEDEELPAGFNPENPITFACELPDCGFCCPSINGLHGRYFDKHGLNIAFATKLITAPHVPAA